MFRAMLRILRGGDHGQDLAEYCLLTALIALIGLGIFCYASGGIQAIWSNMGATLATGNTTTGAGGSTSGGAPSTSQPTGQ
jgi:Flp pilus assembly pilin Flp